MVNTCLNLWFKFKLKWEKPASKAIAFLMLFFFASAASAQSLDGLCSFASFLKSGIGIVAIIAIMIGVIISFLAKISGLMEILIGVLFCLAVAAFAPNLAAKAGFAVSCAGL